MRRFPTTRTEVTMVRPQPTRSADGFGWRREFLLEQLPLFLALTACGFLTGWLQHGHFPGIDGPFPVAGGDVPLWHLMWMGAWTGYIMAIVGEASGILALPYSMSVLNFTAAGVSPTIQLLSLLNPIGALIGFGRGRQWNRDLALWACLGAVPGGLIGPFVRWYVLMDVSAFTLLVGLALGAAGAHLGWAGVRHLRRARSESCDGPAPPPTIPIRTQGRRGVHLTVAYGDAAYPVNVARLTLAGFLVAIVSTALGATNGS